MHAKPSHWMHEISIFKKNCSSPFLAWTNSPIINWGYLLIVGIKIICWFHFSSIVMSSINRGQGKAEICPGRSHYHADGTASHPPLSSTVFSSLSLVYSKLLMLVAGADKTARLPLSFSLSLSLLPYSAKQTQYHFSSIKESARKFSE